MSEQDKIAELEARLAAQEQHSAVLHQTVEKLLAMVLEDAKARAAVTPAPAQPPAATPQPMLMSSHPIPVPAAPPLPSWPTMPNLLEQQGHEKPRLSSGLEPMGQAWPAEQNQQLHAAQVAQVRANS